MEMRGYCSYPGETGGGFLLAIRVSWSVRVVPYDLTVVDLVCSCSFVCRQWRELFIAIQGGRDFR